MKLKIKTMELSDFKGIKSKVYNFEDKTDIIGKNGTGKTTLMTAYMWVFADVDSSLKKNPDVVPIGLEECNPRVDITLDIDGVEIKVAKIQKRKKKKSGEITTSNTYEVNSIEYGLRDFKAKMEEYGFDFEKFLAFSHTDYFVSQKSDDMRKILFQMNTELTPKEVAQVTEGVSNEVVAMFDSYSFEEIEAMQKSSIRKIREVYGKDGDLLDSTIRGIELSKANYDINELLKSESDLLEQLHSIPTVNTTSLENRLFEIGFEINDVRRKANEDLVSTRYKVEEDLRSFVRAKQELERDLGLTTRTVETLESKIPALKEELNALRDKYNAQKEAEFDSSIWDLDEGAEFCKMCGQKLPEDKIKDIYSENEKKKQKAKVRFEEDKDKMLKKYIADGNLVKFELEKNKSAVESEKARISNINSDLKECEKNIEELRNKIDALPIEISVDDNAEYIKLANEKADLEKKIAELQQSVQEDNSDEIKKELLEVRKKISQFQHNEELDKKINELRKSKIQYEQNLADAENILYQLDLISRRRNELISQSINKHFSLVAFKLFDYYKNGEYKECCIPTYDGKDLEVATNTSLEIAMKIDISNGLQTFFNCSYPIWLDNAECLDKDSKSKVVSDSQIIFLTVGE